ncbi:unnamed protein product [Calypogeia fissa]
MYIMEVVRFVTRHWAKRRGPSSLLTFMPELYGRRPVMMNVVARISKPLDEYFVSADQWKPGTNSLSFFTTRKFSSGEAERKKLMPLQERKMIDKFRLHVRGGEGGAGCTSFRKSIQSRHGSADGGNGGSGGDVILVSSAAVWDFSNLQHHLNGTNGGPGSSKKKVGSRGKDKIVQVPVGSVIHIVRGSIPSLDQVLPTREEPTWEEWEGMPSYVKSNPLFDKSQCVKAVSSTENEGVQIQCLASPDLSEKSGQNPSARSLQNSDLMMQGVECGEKGFLEASANNSIPQLRRSSSDGDMSLSSESPDEYDLDGLNDEEDEDSSLRQDVQSSAAEFVKVGQSLIVARGGVGGKGNAAMARGRGSDKALPSLEHELGQPGSEADLILELKTIADVGLVGAPNAGKSTLLGSLSRAKPRTGHYKFTTLRPNIGKVEFDDFFNLTVADIPGLIEGAHENRGLGHAFLRHIERTKVLAYVVDLAGGIADDTGLRPWDQFQRLVFELEQYHIGLSQRPSILVANKVDEEGALEALEVLRQKIPKMEIYPVCAVLEEGVEELKIALRRLVESSQSNSPSLLQFSDALL